jgi:hypothetical protein
VPADVRHVLLCALLAGCASAAPQPPKAGAAVRVDLLYAVPAAAHRELAHLHGRQGELRKQAAALGADALVVLKAREDGIDALAIEYLDGGERP